jgi:hypothetical protein
VWNTIALSAMEDIAMDKIPEFRPVGKEGKLAKRDTQEVFLSLSQIPLNEYLSTVFL